MGQFNITHFLIHYEKHVICEPQIKPKLSDPLQNNWPIIFKNVKFMKGETVLN